jgi:hypothetical protein
VLLQELDKVLELEQHVLLQNLLVRRGETRAVWRDYASVALRAWMLVFGLRRP